MKTNSISFSLSAVNALILSSLSAALFACGGNVSSNDGKTSVSIGDETSPEENQNGNTSGEEAIIEVTNTAGEKTKAAQDNSITLSLVEYGDMFTGKPYILRYTVKSSNGTTSATDNFKISAKYGEFSKTHPQTGKTAPAGQIYYYVPETVLGSTENYYYFAEAISLTTASGETRNYRMNVGTNAGADPLFTDQWHIKNIGQNPFSVRKVPVAGIDHNVIPAWHLTDANDELISGNNVRVAVWDTKVDFNHEDLTDKKYTPSSRASFINAALSLNEVKQDSSVLHGTMVSGIIGAKAGNGKGVRGIAYNAQLASYEANSTNVAYLARKKDLDIANASLGLDNSYAYEPTLEMYYQSMFENNIPLIKAAGNEFGRVTFTSGSYYPQKCVNLGISCQFNQTSSFNRGRYLINVGAINSLGRKASYSTVGSHLWVSGTGGEFGYTGTSDSSAAIVTTKYSYDPEYYNEGSESRTPWRTAKDTYSLRKNYTHTMNGTSSATPSVTGVSTLVIQAKPDITVPQLRYILAVTANNDTSAGWSTLKYTPVKSTVSEYGRVQFAFDNGWHNNAAGLRFSNYYGFGVVNAYEAVKKALTCNQDELCRKRAVLPEDYKSTGTNPCSSADNGKTVTCIFSSFVNADSRYSGNDYIDIENTSLNMSSFTYANDSSSSECRSAYQGNTRGIAYANNLLQIEMTSPNGTRALIKPVYANWDFDGRTMRKMLGLSNYRYDFLLNVSDYFTEVVPANGEFMVKFTSKCPIDVNTLNQNIYVLLGGYRE